MAFPRLDLPLTDGVVAVRPLDDRDVAAVDAASRDAEILRWMGTPDASAEDQVRQAREAWEAGTAAIFGICDMGDQACRGVVIIETRPAGRADAGYWVLPEHRGRRLAAHALRLAAEWALTELPIGRVQLWTHPENLASQRVAEQAGFVREGVLRAYGEERNGRRADALFFSLIKSDLG